MKCPFVSGVSKSLFQRSDLTLSNAINYCPFILQQRAFHNSTRHENFIPGLKKSDMRSLKTELELGSRRSGVLEEKTGCPYTAGETAPNSKCPITGIDVSRQAHSEVLHDINITTPVEIPDEIPERMISKVWKNQLEDMIQIKKNDETYRKFSVINRDTNRPPSIEKVVPNRAFPLPRESYCSNDYLNMTSHPKVIEACKQAAEIHGTGAGGTRNISGTSELTNALETEIRDWHRTEDALVFNGCYVANVETLSTLLGRHFPGAQCFSDAGNHRSMIEGIQKGKMQQQDPKNRAFVFRHDDPVHLEELLSKEYAKDPTLPRIVAFESVHSMGGNIQKIEELCDVAHKYGALTFCDEVHAVGLYGATGAGIAEQRGIQHKIDIISGTLGKGVGGSGGYIAASADIVDTVRQYAPGFIFTSALPPPVLATNIASIRVLKGMEGRVLRSQHFTAVEVLRSELEELGIPYKKLEDASHLTAVELKSAKLADSVMKKLDSRGFYVQAIKSPTVPVGQEMLRLTVSPQHLRFSDTIPRFARKLAEVL